MIHGQCNSSFIPFPPVVSMLIKTTSIMLSMNVEKDHLNSSDRPKLDDSEVSSALGL